MEITGKTVITGIIGNPVVHSLSPLMHQAAFAACQLDYCYVAFPVTSAHLHNALNGLRSLGIRGVNVTIPHKVAVIPFLDSISQEATCIGAVNTIVFEQGSAHGYNTDGTGFMAALHEKTNCIQEKHVCLLGAGGSARAIAFQLLSEGCQSLAIMNRTLHKAEALKASLMTHFPKAAVQTMSYTKAGITASDIIINTTAVGMSPQDRSLIPKEWLSSAHLCVDIIYKPQATCFLKAAMEAGAETLSGAGMLLWQGALAFEKWTGTKAPVSIMKQALEQCL